ncbi:tetratricopeptide repeat protein [Novipirellula artificiosorum]|uniref:Tetratricopeptide repeat protein n=1 Tax=Novipirellula artificiosorum TaxID=2528016 RepID=A0A5C6DJK1_9BACT|nr:hypothetical protein [Novipirellula artificiosorum]TWU35086.1 Tetratricopeptide repeat protein [Novipirellula artificiosorum]
MLTGSERFAALLRPANLRGLLPLILIVVALETGTAKIGVCETGGSLDALGTTADTLIEQLGSQSYATRLRARESLQRMGLEAFDELHAAQYHPDSEIAMTARHLVSSLLVSWSKETDPEQVREILHEYGAQTEDERRARIAMLAELPKHEGLAALVRLTRFETSLALSRVAALSLMRQTIAEDETAHRVEQIQLGLGQGDRAPVIWLAAYADDLKTGVVDAKRWDKLIDQQRQQLDTASAVQTTRPSILELVRVCANQAWLRGQTDDAQQLVEKHLDLVTPTTRELSEACRWAIKTGLYSTVLELRNRHTQLFDAQPMLLYSAAEALNASHDPEGGEALAVRALGTQPIPSDLETQEKWSPNDLAERAQSHREIADHLQSRGLFDWAEAEYRMIIDRLDIVSMPSTSARISLAQMLGDLLQHQQVVDVLTPLVNRISSDDQFRNQLNFQHRNLDAMRSMIHWHGALAKIEQGEIEQAKPMLEKALRIDPTNIDILIDMYRLEQDDPQWTQQTETLIKMSTRDTQKLIDERETQLRRPGQFFGMGGSLADLLNQYAWLVSNTQGDYARALRYSRRSLELLPNEPAQLDTLARCYYAVGDFQNAYATQVKAVQLMPHSPPMLRQLELLEKAAQADLPKQ